MARKQRASKKAATRVEKPFLITPETLQQHLKKTAGTEMRVFTCPMGSVNIIDPRCYHSKGLVQHMQKTLAHMQKYQATIQRLSDMCTDYISELMCGGPLRLYRFALTGFIDSEMNEHMRLWDEFAARSKQEHQEGRCMRTPEMDELDTCLRTLKRELEEANDKLFDLIDAKKAFEIARIRERSANKSSDGPKTTRPCGK